jgi:hypothetical protein
MTWVKLDDTLHGHPKALEAGLEAMGLWTLTLSHCGAYLTDGHVKRAAALRITGNAQALDRLAAVLARVRLWELHPSGDGWQVHDYLAFNPSREQVLAEREKKQKAGRASAEKRWGKGAGDGSGGNSSGNTCYPPATGSGDAPVPIPSRPDPDPDPERETRAPRAGGELERNPGTSRSVTKRVTGDPRTRAGKGPKAAAARGTNGNDGATGQASHEAKPKTRYELLAGEESRTRSLVLVALDCLEHGEAVPDPAAQALEAVCRRRHELVALVHEAQAAAPARTGTA